MRELKLSMGEPFTSPAWGSDFVVFFSESGRPVQEPDAKDYINRACKYARHHGVYLVPERFVLMGYQSMCLISPQGKVLGAQKSCHANLASRQQKRSSTLEVISTEFGGIFLCVDVDIYQPQIAKIACAMGAQIIICAQQIFRGDYSNHMVLSGPWSAAQHNAALVVDCCNQFCCVCAPLELTPRRDGFLVPPSLKLPVTATLDAGVLTAVPKRFPLARRFYALHSKELIGV